MNQQAGSESGFEAGPEGVMGMIEQAAGKRRPRRRSLLTPAMALIFLLGAIVCTSAWAAPGGHGGASRSGFHGAGVAHGGGYGGHGRYGGGRGRFGVYLGGPAYWGYGYGYGWYNYPYYDYSPVVVVPAPSLWYFCDDPQGYYPYVKQCATPWRAVAPDTSPR